MLCDRNYSVRYKKNGRWIFCKNESGRKLVYDYYTAKEVMKVRYYCGFDSEIVNNETGKWIDRMGKG